MKNKITALFLFTLCLSPRAEAQLSLQLEGGGLWQSVNSVGIPGNTGTRFSLVDYGKGPVPAYRAYIGYKFNERHEIRGLYAPLSFELDGQFDSVVSFQGTNFAAATATTAKYKFNSYRLTYAYHFESSDGWQWALGFTGKIRDAEIGLTQGGISAKKDNIGFVPLLNVQALYSFDEMWRLRIDFDGMAAPQGRAFDVLIALDHEFVKDAWSGYLGYRTVEGGADNETVHNFAWLHQAVLGFRGSL